MPFDGRHAVAVALKQVSEQPRAAVGSSTRRSRRRSTPSSCGRSPRTRRTASRPPTSSRARSTPPRPTPGGALGDTAAYAAVGVAAALAGAAGAAMAADRGGALAAEQEAAQRRTGRLDDPPRARSRGARAARGRGRRLRAHPARGGDRPDGDRRAGAGGAGAARGRGLRGRPAPAPSCAPADTVIEQDPPAGTEAEEGSTVTITVSLGPAVKVPPRSRACRGEARERLEDAELLVATASVLATSSRGRVIGTEPGGRHEVDCGSTVTLLVSTGANLVDAARRDRPAARRSRGRARAAGFIVDVDTRDADEPEGEVIGQDPGPGRELLRGRPVTIVVSTGAGSVIVPDVEGQTERRRLARPLERAGLDVDVDRARRPRSRSRGRRRARAGARRPGTRVRTATR